MTKIHLMPLKPGTKKVTLLIPTGIKAEWKEEDDPIIEFDENGDVICPEIHFDEVFVELEPVQLDGKDYQVGYVAPIDTVVIIDNLLGSGDALSEPFITAIGEMALSHKARLEMREGLLKIVDLLEREMGLEQTTARCRKIVKGKL